MVREAAERVVLTLPAEDIPMMGAVLQTVNVRLSPEQIAYTIDHAGASTLLNADILVVISQDVNMAHV
jgi:acyl-CoA synthetase (AMP-forming)/AMP-acid ligase II